MSDIRFHTQEYIFSYRTAGILVREGKVLLQKTDDDDGFAIPGGHVSFGETNAETLKREFAEECSAEIKVGQLRAVAEIFFPWEGKTCHQICTYYQTELADPNSLPRTDTFMTKENLEGREFPVRFYWVPIKELPALTIYPPQIVSVLIDNTLPIQHFVYEER